VGLSSNGGTCDARRNDLLSLNSSSCVNKILSLPSLNRFAEGPRLAITVPIVVANLIAMIEVVERLEVVVRLTGS
jgi:hypothetical protein